MLPTLLVFIIPKRSLTTSFLLPPPLPVCPYDTVETGLGVTVASAAPMLQSSENTLWTLDIHGNTGTVTAGYGSYYGSYGDNGGGYYSSGNGYYGNNYGGGSSSGNGYDNSGYYSNYDYNYGGSGYGTSFDRTFNPVVSFNMSLPGIDPSQYPGGFGEADGSEGWWRCTQRRSSEDDAWSCGVGEGCVVRNV